VSVRDPPQCAPGPPQRYPQAVYRGGRSSRIRQARAKGEAEVNTRWEVRGATLHTCADEHQGVVHRHPNRARVVARVVPTPTDAVPSRPVPVPIAAVPQGSAAHGRRIDPVTGDAVPLTLDWVDECRMLSDRLLIQSRSARTACAPRSTTTHQPPNTGDNREQAYFPAEQPSSRQDARFPSAHAHPCRPLDPVCSPQQGPQAPRGLTRRPVSLSWSVSPRVRGSAARRPWLGPC
jgi:hypothetical protein